MSEPTEQQIRTASVTIGDLFDALDRVSRKASARAYGSVSPVTLVTRDAVLALCDGMKEELRQNVLRAFEETCARCDGQRASAVHDDNHAFEPRPTSQPIKGAE